MGHKPKKSDFKRSKDPPDHDHQMKLKYVYFSIFLLTLLFSVCRCFDKTLQISNGTDFSSDLRTLSVDCRNLLGWSYFVVTEFPRRLKLLWNSNQLEDSLWACFNLQVLLLTTTMILQSGDVEPNPGPGMNSN